MSEHDTTKRYQRALTPAELDALPDEDIDYSEIPPADERFWRTATVVRPQNGDLGVVAALSPDARAYFRTDEAGSTTRLVAALEEYVRDRRGARG